MAETIYDFARELIEDLADMDRLAAYEFSTNIDADLKNIAKHKAKSMRKVEEYERKAEVSDSSLHPV